VLEDEEEGQDVETTQNLAVESHSQQKESSASLTEQKVDEGRLLEEGEHELHHNAPPMPPNDSGNVIVSNCPVESKVTVAEQTGQGSRGRLKLSRTASLPASKTRIPQCHSASPRATRQPPNSAHPIIGDMRESKIPVRIGKFDRVIFETCLIYI